jgi:hypothetical protein
MEKGGLLFQAPREILDPKVILAQRVILEIQAQPVNEELKV